MNIKYGANVGSRSKDTLTKINEAKRGHENLSEVSRKIKGEKADEALKAANSQIKKYHKLDEADQLLIRQDLQIKDTDLLETGPILASNGLHEAVRDAKLWKDMNKYEQAQILQERMLAVVHDQMERTIPLTNNKLIEQLTSKSVNKANPIKLATTPSQTILMIENLGAFTGVDNVYLTGKEFAEQKAGHTLMKKAKLSNTPILKTGQGKGANIMITNAAGKELSFASVEHFKQMKLMEKKMRKELKEQGDNLKLTKQKRAELLAADKVELVAKLKNQIKANKNKKTRSAKKNFIEPTPEQEKAYEAQFVGTTKAEIAEDNLIKEIMDGYHKEERNTFNAEKNQKLNRLNAEIAQAEARIKKVEKLAFPDDNKFKGLQIYLKGNQKTLRATRSRLNSYRVAAVKAAEEAVLLEVNRVLDTAIQIGRSEKSLKVLIKDPNLAATLEDMIGTLEALKAHGAESLLKLGVPLDSVEALPFAHGEMRKIADEASTIRLANGFIKPNKTAKQIDKQLSARQSRNTEGTVKETMKRLANEPGPQELAYLKNPILSLVTDINGYENAATTFDIIDIAV
nr:hypothetical protein [Colwellia sp.]